jgi:hypothetical protein
MSDIFGILEPFINGDLRSLETTPIEKSLNDFKVDSKNKLTEKIAGYWKETLSSKRLKDNPDYLRHSRMVFREKSKKFSISVENT